MFSIQAATGQYGHAGKVKLEGDNAQRVESAGSVGEIQIAAMRPISRPTSPQEVF